MKKLLTIAIPTYNRLDTLKKTLESVINETENYLSDVDIYIANNCSPDNTIEYLQTIVEKYPFIKVMNRSKNIGPDGNFLAILQESESKFVHILSDDDILIEGSLRNVVTFLQNADENLSLVFLNYVRFCKNYSYDDLCNYEKHIKSGVTQITNDKKVFIDNVKLEFTFLSSLVFSKKHFLSIDTPEKYLGTNWLQSYLAILSTRETNSKLGVIFEPTIAVFQMDHVPNFNPFKIFGPNLLGLISCAIDCGYNKKQMMKLFYARCLTMYRSIGKYKIERKKVFKDFKPMFNVTWRNPIFWFRLYPALFIPRFIYSIGKKRYFENRR